MDLKSKCGLWTKTENLASIQTPEIGANGGATAGITYPAAKFGNGSNSPAGNDQYIIYPRTDINFNPNKWGTEFWVDTNDWTVTDGVPSDSLIHRWWDWFLTNLNRITIWQSTTALVFAFVVNNTPYYFEPTTGITYDSSLHHIFQAFDRLGIDGGAETLRMYIDKNKVAASSISVPIQNLSGGNCHFHNIQFDSNFYQNYNASLDNIKVYFDMSEEIIVAVNNNNENEGWPVEGIPLINGGLRSSLLRSNMLN